eukprot:GGOE01019079.1.p1 GENE.GGOE01019079.1~~GGOE01019079.1.p1  ORF type:complete len:315 (+),score=88.64 GGOE01019079.1:30-947(+)
MAAALRDFPTEVPDALFRSMVHLCTPLDPLFARGRALIRDQLPGSTVRWLDRLLAQNENVHARRLPLMDPYDVLIIALVYILVVALLNIIMRVVPSPKETRLMKLFQLGHNAFLTLLSLYMCGEILRQAILRGYSVWFNNLDNGPGGWPMAKILWVFYASKIYEFADTVIMLLRQSFRQVTFLHVYHHLSIFPIWWLVIFLGPTGDSYFSAALNSFVHVVMYSYYLLATFNVSVPWKYHITKFQMLQFLANLIQAACLWWFPIPGYPRLLAQVLFMYMITLLLLFYNFYTTSRKHSRARTVKKYQ